MDIRLDHGYIHPFDVDDHQMGLGLADVILNDQFFSDPRGCGPKPGMLELEREGPIQPVHEGRHKLSVPFPQHVRLCPSDVLLSDSCLQRVQGPVQVHHQDMNAVRAFPHTGCDRLVSWNLK